MDVLVFHAVHKRGVQVCRSLYCKKFVDCPRSELHSLGSNVDSLLVRIREVCIKLLDEGDIDGLFLQLFLIWVFRKLFPAVVNDHVIHFLRKAESFSSGKDEHLFLQQLLRLNLLVAFLGSLVLEYGYFYCVRRRRL
ncbi:hypothetical protein GQ457_16G021080 [Hibiscus cannabinus]